jgi:hypothetical protein
MHAVATITRIIADVSPDGSALLLRVQANGVDSDFTLAQSDVGGLVHMLLALAAAAQDPAPQGSADRTRSIPVDAVSIGETVLGDALLGLQIGSVELAFEFPKERLRRLGETLLSVSADRRLPT